jgi:hypothetical protein
LIFTPAAAFSTASTFTAMASDLSDVTAMSTTSRWAGVLNGAAYQVEVPANWNGKLVMYAHGYAGAGLELAVGAPSIRRYLIQNGYAWAASSYSKNNYDVRAGVEDTNALALEFTKIAEKILVVWLHRAKSTSLAIQWVGTSLQQQSRTRPTPQPGTR